jgi:hypothetical protein
VDSQTHGVAAPGQIERAPNVGAVLTSTQFAALRARNALACRFGDKHQAPIALDEDQDDAPVI